MYPKNFLSFYSTFKSETRQTFTKVSNKIQLIKKFNRSYYFLVEENLSAEKVNENEVKSSWNLNKKYTETEFFFFFSLSLSAEDV